MNIISELENSRNKRVDKISSSTGKANSVALLGQGSVDQRQALRSIGLSNHLDRVTELKSEEIVTESLENDYNQKVYTEEDIKALCVKFNLRFVRSSYYNAEIPESLGDAISTFAKEHNVNLGDPYVDRAFMVLATKRELSLNSSNKAKSPMLFYAIKSDKYVLIHKWGSKSHGILRYAAAFFKRNVYTVIFGRTLGIASALYILLGIFGLHGVGPYSVLLGLSAVVNIIAGSIGYSDDDLIASEYNWDDTSDIKTR